MIANKEVVKNLIPQKSPFVMVDELLVYTENSILTQFTVVENNIFTKNCY